MAAISNNLCNTFEPQVYLPRKTVIELLCPYARPYLDYGDITYHIPHNICNYKHVTLNNRMDRLEPVQYSAALAVTGAWKGTWRSTWRSCMMNWVGNRSISVDGVGALFCFTRCYLLLPQIIQQYQFHGSRNYLTLFPKRT